MNLQKLKHALSMKILHFIDVDNINLRSQVSPWQEYVLAMTKQGVGSTNGSVKGFASQVKELE